MTWLVAPLLMCWLLSAVHAVLGFRVIDRNIVFLDLALAQIAAFGALIGILSGMAHEGLGVFLSAMGMTAIGAVFFAFVPLRDRGVSQEVIIGLTYVMAVAGVVIVLHASPAEAYHLTDMLVGNILFVSLAEVARLAVYYVAVFAAYYGIRRWYCVRLLPQSRWHDFLFYLVFGWVVTSSVKVAGVLLVFTFLIVPAVAACWWGAKTPMRRWIGATLFGMLFSVLGVGLSLWQDWPTGAAIVLAAGGALLVFRGVVVLSRFGVDSHPYENP